MDGTPRDNDISKIVEADRAHIWHHLIQHCSYIVTAPPITLFIDVKLGLIYYLRMGGGIVARSHLYEGA